MTYEEHTEKIKLEQLNRLEKTNLELASKLAETEVNYENLKELLKNKDKQIDLMTSYLAVIRDCPNEDKGANLDCENRCSNDENIYAECWKMYFERKCLDERN